MNGDIRDAERAARSSSCFIVAALFGMESLLLTGTVSDCAGRVCYGADRDCFGESISDAGVEGDGFSLCMTL